MLGELRLQACPEEARFWGVPRRGRVAVLVAVLTMAWLARGARERTCLGNESDDGLNHPEYRGIEDTTSEALKATTVATLSMAQAMRWPVAQAVASSGERSSGISGKRQLRAAPLRAVEAAQSAASRAR
ncbi:hypothetical protein B296_00003066 [Ensete ventricosum]|uniref:Uncharacterized protein n=1 Tax=Ensete ventricosum TaxID=4639 RepID=A0A427B7L7_ENSVE|nr:hypothetical protein B296_00003066 [Ensete ventricosum]